MNTDSNEQFFFKLSDCWKYDLVTIILSVPCRRIDRERTPNIYDRWKELIAVKWASMGRVTN